MRDRQRPARDGRDELVDRFDADSPLLLERGILRRQLLPNQRQVGVGALDRCVRGEAREHRRPVRRARRALAARRQHRRNEVEIVLDHPGAARQHADDSARHFVEHDVAADDAGIGGESRLPELLGEQDDVVLPARSIVVRDEAAAEERRDAQHLQELVRDLEAAQPFRRAAVAQVGGDAPGEDYGVELRPVRAPVEERAAGRTVEAAVGSSLGDLDQPIRLWIWRRVQEERIEHAVDRGVGADAEAKRHDGDDGERRGADEQACGERKILAQVRREPEQPAAPLESLAAARGVGKDRRRAAKLAFGRQPRRVAAHTAGDQLVGAQVEMMGPLGGDIGVDVAARSGGEAKQASDITGPHAGSPHPGSSITLRIAAA